MVSVPLFSRSFRKQQPSQSNLVSRPVSASATLETAKMEVRNHPSPSPDSTISSSDYILNPIITSANTSSNLSVVEIIDDDEKENVALDSLPEDSLGSNIKPHIQTQSFKSLLPPLQESPPVENDRAVSSSSSSSNLALSHVSSKSKMNIQSSQKQGGCHSVFSSFRPKSSSRIKNGKDGLLTETIIDLMDQIQKDRYSKDIHIEQLTDQLTVSNLEIEGLNSKLIELKGKCHEFIESVASYKQQSIFYNKRITALIRCSSLYEISQKRLILIINDICDEKNKVQSKILDMQNMMNQNEKELQDAHKALLDREQKSRDFESELQNQFESLKAQLSQSEMHTKELDEQISDLKLLDINKDEEHSNKIKSLQNYTSSLNDKLKNLTDENFHIKNEYELIIKQNSEMEENLKVKEVSNEEMKIKVVTLENTIFSDNERFTSIISELKTQISKLQIEYSDMINELSEKKASLIELNELKSELSLRVKELTIKCEVSEKMNIDLALKVEQHVKEKEEIEIQRSNLIKSLETRDGRINTLTEIEKSLNEDITILKSSEHMITKTKHEEAMEKLKHDHEIALNQLRNHNQTCIDRRDAEISNLKAQNSTLLKANNKEEEIKDGALKSILKNVKSNKSEKIVAFKAGTFGSTNSSDEISQDVKKSNSEKSKSSHKNNVLKSKNSWPSIYQNSILNLDEDIIHDIETATSIKSHDVKRSLQNLNFNLVKESNKENVKKDDNNEDEDEEIRKILPTRKQLKSNTFNKSKSNTKSNFTSSRISLPRTLNRQKTDKILLSQNDDDNFSLSSNIINEGESSLDAKNALDILTKNKTSSNNKDSHLINSKRSRKNKRQKNKVSIESAKDDNLSGLVDENLFS